MSVIVCRPKILKPEMLEHAERRALAINPANEAERHTIERTPVGHRGGPLRKTFYSTIAATVALSACYPKQSASLLDQVIVRVRNESKYLLDSTSQC